MRNVQRIAAQNADLERFRASGEFIRLATTLAATRGDHFEARALAREQNVSARLSGILEAPESKNILQKAAVGALSTSNASALQDFRLLSSGFSGSVASVSVFQALFSGGMHQLPLGPGTTGVISTGVVGAVVREGMVKPISSLVVSSGEVSPSKAIAAVVTTTEFARFGGANANTIIGNELRKAAAAAVDAEFLAVLLAGVTVGTSSGQTAAAVRADLASMLAQVSTDPTSRLYLITTPLIAKMWSVMGAAPTGDSSAAFPELSEGRVGSIPVITSSAITAGQVILVDATGLAGSSSDFTLDALTETSLQFDSAPDSPPVAGTNVVNLWQTNQVVIVAERWWSAIKNRANCVAAVSNANSYVAGFSPP